MRLYSYISILFLIFSCDVFCQEDTTTVTEEQKYKHLFTSSSDPLKNEEKEEEITAATKKKKVSRRIFFGKKTKLGYTQSGYGTKQTIEKFRFLKVHEDPSHYVDDIYWYNLQKQKIEKTRYKKIDFDHAKILHGPYIKTINGEVIERGMFYVGTKQGRWERYTKSRDYDFKSKTEEDTTITYQILLEKESYNKGWTKESKITYHDREKTLVNEVMPIKNKKKEGEYFRYFKSGHLAEHGVYENDKKIGEWREYFEAKKNSVPKKITIYAPDAFTEYDSYILKEWDETRKVITDNSQRKKEEDEKRRAERFKRY